MYWVESLDPRIRLLALMVFALVVVSLSHLWSLLGALLIALLVMLGAKLSWWETLKRMLTMDAFIIFMLFTLPFTIAGDTWFTLWGFDASWQGFSRAVEIALKANSIMLMLLALTSSLEAIVLAQALGKLGMPSGLVHLMLFTVRYIAVLKNEYQRLRMSMKARAFKPKNNLHTYRSIGFLLGMLLVKAIERSERVLQAMKCRGFNGQLPMLSTWQMGYKEGLFGLAFLVLMSGLIISDVLIGDRLIGDIYSDIIQGNVYGKS